MLQSRCTLSFLLLALSLTACGGPSGQDVGTGGSAGAGGLPATGGQPATGGALPAGGSGGLTDQTCEVIATHELAPNIPTVGIVTFSTTAEQISSATIDFGPDESYGMQAPVDLSQPDYRTLLLGIPSNETFHYRVTVQTPTGSCSSADELFQSGGLPAGGPSDTTPTRGMSSAEVAPGFIVTTLGIGSGGPWAFISNKDGRIVWAFQFNATNEGFQAGGLPRALLSWDGNYFYARELGPFNEGSGGYIFRVRMDGTEQETFTLPGGSHHDLAVTPSGFAYIAKQAAGECDHIFTANHDGSGAESLIDLYDALENFTDDPSGPELCHVNALRYSENGDYFTVSDREKDVIVKISRSGEVLESYGKAPNPDVSWSHFLADGSGTTWRVQHGHHLYAPDKLLVFSNGPFGNGTSRVLHYSLVDGTATLDWQYSEMGTSQTLGDVQALPNGNVLVTQSQGGNIDEIDPQQRMIQRLKFNGSAGYSQHRTRLYGAPD